MSHVYIIGLSDTKERVPAAAGRISTQEGTALGIFNSFEDEAKDARLISKVTRSGHDSIIEHTYFNLAFEDVSVVVEQFMIEHRLAAFTVKSRRYVDFAGSGYFVPELRDAAAEKKYRSVNDALFAEYEAFIRAGVPKEDARFVLPYSFCSNFYCSVNARELLLILRSMLFGRGSLYPEIKRLGTELRSAAERLTPGIFTSFDERRPFSRDSVDLGPAFDAPDSGETQQKPPVELLRGDTDAARFVCVCALIAGRGMSTSQAYAATRKEEDRRRILDRVFEGTRPRPLEHINYTFRINGVSLSCVTHFARHRMQSLEVPSLACTDRSRHIVPATIARDPELLRRYEAAFAGMKELYDGLRAQSFSAETLVNCQLSGSCVDIVTTMNARELLLFIRLRSCERAQWEIRDFAREMLRLLREAEPEIFDRYGPSCYLGRCPEGSLTCGKAAQIREDFTPKKPENDKNGPGVEPGAPASSGGDDSGV